MHNARAIHELFFTSLRARGGEENGRERWAKNPSQMQKESSAWERIAESHRTFSCTKRLEWEKCIGLFDVRTARFGSRRSWVIDSPSNWNSFSFSAFSLCRELPKRAFGIWEGDRGEKEALRSRLGVCVCALVPIFLFRIVRSYTQCAWTFVVSLAGNRKMHCTYINILPIGSYCNRRSARLAPGAVSKIHWKRNALTLTAIATKV